MSIWVRHFKLFTTIYNINEHIEFNNLEEGVVDF